MATMLTIGAWAENLWTGEHSLDYYGFAIEESMNLSAGDVLTFTVTGIGDWPGITLKTISREPGYASPGTTELISVTPTVGTVTIIVDDAIANAATEGLWVYGTSNVTVTSVDLTRKTTVNVYDGEAVVVNYWTNNLPSATFAYASVGDVLQVTVSAIGDNQYYRKLVIQDAEGGPNDGNILYTCENTSLVEGAINIPLTSEMIALAKEGSLYIGGYEYSYNKIDLLTSPTVSISDAGYATFCYSAPLDLTGIEAYTAAVNGDIVALTSVEGKKIPADTPIILKGSGDVVIPITADATDEITGNDLLVSDGNVTGNGSIYVLANGISGVGFYKLELGSTLPKGKAYLLVSSANAKKFYGFDDATDINMINASKAETNACYNLNGQRVSANTKGIYIVNGKKVIIK